MKSLFILFTFTLLLSCKEAPPQTEKSLVPTADTIVSQQEELPHDGTEGRTLVFETEHTFDSFKADVYKGNLSAPDFNGNPFANDPEYVKLITEGCKDGVNYAGKYTLIHKGCGAMCEHIFIVDRTNGKIFTGAIMNSGKYGYLYKKESRLLIANSEAFLDESLTVYSDLFATPEFYVWEGNNFKFLQ